MRNRSAEMHEQVALPLFRSGVLRIWVRKFTHMDVLLFATAVLTYTYIQA